MKKSMIRRIAVVAVIALVFSLIGVFPTDDPDTALAALTKDANGYYQINTGSDLYEIRTIVEGDSTTGTPAEPYAKFKLTADVLIQMGGANPYWTPVRGFKGEFDGDGHTIQGVEMQIGASRSSNIGFFESLDGATVKNINFLYCGVIDDSFNPVPAGTTIRNVGIVAGSISSGSTVSGITLTSCNVMPYMQAGATYTVEDAGVFTGAMDNTVTVTGITIGASCNLNFPAGATTTRVGTADAAAVAGVVPVPTSTPTSTPTRTRNYS